MTPIADMVERMLSGGISPDVIVMAIRTAEQHAGKDPVTEKRRAYDRERKRKVRSAGKSADTSTGQSADMPRSCNLDLSKKETTEEKKERKVTARGTRLPPDAALSEADREFARSFGFSDARIDQLWAEFVDYWSAVPGAKGVKLRWPATWRNRVRTVAGREGLAEQKPNGHAADIGFYATFGSPEQDAWDAHGRQIGKSYPRDKRGGWVFPTRWPPGHENAEAA